MEREEQAERDRLRLLELQLINEMRQKLLAILEQTTAVSDVRENDVKEAEYIDQQIQLAVIGREEAEQGWQ